MGNSRTDTELKIYKNSICTFCLYSFSSRLEIRFSQKLQKSVIICNDCYIKYTKAINDRIKTTKPH